MKRLLFYCTCKFFGNPIEFQDFVSTSQKQKYKSVLWQKQSMGKMKNHWGNRLVMKLDSLEKKSAILFLKKTDFRADLKYGPKSN